MRVEWVIITEAHKATVHLPSGRVAATVRHTPHELRIVVRKHAVANESEDHQDYRRNIQGILDIIATHAWTWNAE